MKNEGNENKEKRENDKKILSQIEEIRKKYKVDSEDKTEDELSFLDKLNKLVQLILNDSSVSVYHALNEKTLEKWRKKRFSRWLKNLIFNNYSKSFYFILLVSITGFLVSEALSFYAIDGEYTTKTYVKAILIEVCFIFLSGYKAYTKLLKVWVNFLRAGIFSLMLFVISSQAITTGTKDISGINAIEQQIELIEKQIDRKEEKIEYYQEKDWPITTKQLIREKDKLVDKLITLKEKQQQGSNKDVAQIKKYKMYGRAAFRVLLLFISVLITRRIFLF